MAENANVVKRVFKEPDHQLVPPTKLFDNLFYIGYVDTGCLLIKTSEGLILVDAMWNCETDAKTVIIPGIQQLGFDPKDLKAILLTHGHGDHWGGSKYIQDTYGPHIYLTEVDWELLQTDDKMPNIPHPKTDKFITDGEMFTLGDTSIEVVLTPGHSPGGVNYILPVFDNGEKHMCAIIGGLGVPRGKLSFQLRNGQLFVCALENFTKIALERGVDTLTGPHYLKDEAGYDALMKLQTRKPGEVNPMLADKDGFKKYMNNLINTIKNNNEHVAKMIDELEEKNG